jgi:hypothetical protein
MCSKRYLLSRCSGKQLFFLNAIISGSNAYFSSVELPSERSKVGPRAVVFVAFGVQCEALDDEFGRDGAMLQRTKTAGLTLLVLVAPLLLAPAAYPQGLGKKGGKHGPPAENQPKVDEKAYKAALDRIPTPKQGYDPWGQVHSSDPAKTGGPKSGK